MGNQSINITAEPKIIAEAIRRRVWRNMDKWIISYRRNQKWKYWLLDGADHRIGMRVLCDLVSLLKLRQNEAIDLLEWDWSPDRSSCVKTTIHPVAELLAAER